MRNSILAYSSMMFALATVPVPIDAQQRMTPSTSWLTLADLQQVGVDQNGTSIHIQLTISSSGKIDRCSILLLYGPLKVGRSLCELIVQRAQYLPQHRPDGTPVKSSDSLGLKVEDNKLIVTRDLGGARLKSLNISSGNYPSKAFGAGLEGMVRISLKVGPDGRATHCEVVKSSKVESLDTETCRQAYAGFSTDPVRDSRGKALDNEALVSVCWSYETLLHDTDPCR